jgi:hypothetical protein
MGAQYSANLLINLNNVSDGEYAVYCFVNGLDTISDVGFTNRVVNLLTKMGEHVRVLLPPAVSASAIVIIAAWKETVRTQDWNVVQPYLLVPLVTDGLSEALVLSRTKLVTCRLIQGVGDNIHVRLVGEASQCGCLIITFLQGTLEDEYGKYLLDLQQRIYTAYILCTAPNDQEERNRLTSLFVFITELLANPDHGLRQDVPVLKRREK